MRSELSLNTQAKAAVKAFRDAKPWKGTDLERGDKFAELHRGICAAHNLETLLVRDDSSGDERTPSDNSRFILAENKIVLSGRFSVMTYLFLIGLALQAPRVPRDGASRAMTFANGIFRHYFPRSASRCTSVGGILRKPGTERDSLPMDLPDDDGEGEVQWLEEDPE